MKNDTPETDAEAKKCWNAMPIHAVRREFARKLERQRNEAREDNSRLERIVKDLNDANRVLFESQREAAGLADEKPDGQAENDQSPATAGDAELH
jgi:hypothetical protein